MATRLTKAVVREVQTDARRPLIVELSPAGIRFREKGRRTWIGPVPCGMVLVWAANGGPTGRKRTRGPRGKVAR